MNKACFLQICNTFDLTINQDRLMCLMCMTDDQVIDLRRKKFEDYDTLEQINNEVKTGVLRLQDAPEIVFQRLQKIEFEYPPPETAMDLLKTVYEIEVLSCPIFKDRNGNFVPQYQLENYE